LNPDGRTCEGLATLIPLVSDIAIFVLKRDVKLQLTNSPPDTHHGRIQDFVRESGMELVS